VNIAPKVRNSALSGAVSVILLYVLTGPLGVDLPSDAALAIPVIVAACVGYFTSQGSWTSRA